MFTIKFKEFKVVYVKYIVTLEKLKWFLEKNTLLLTGKIENFIFLIYFTLILMHFTYHAKRNILNFTFVYAII